MALVFVTSWRRVGIVVVLKWGKQQRRVADSYKASWHFSPPSEENSKELRVAKAVPASQDARKWSPVDSEGRVNGLTIRNFLWFMYTKERETVCHWQIARLVRGSRYISRVLKKRPHDRQGDESVVGFSLTFIKDRCPLKHWKQLRADERRDWNIDISNTIFRNLLQLRGGSAIFELSLLLSKVQLYDLYQRNKNESYL